MAQPIEIPIRVNDKDLRTKLPKSEDFARDTGKKIDQALKAKLELDVAQFQLRLSDVRKQVRSAT